MTPSQKGRYGCEAARDTKWKLTAPPVPVVKHPRGATQPWPIQSHPAGKIRKSHLPPPPLPPPPPPQLPLFHTRHAEESAERPHLVTIVRPCGHSTLRKVTVLLNRRGVVSFEQLLLDLSEALGFPRWHRARVTRLFTTHAQEVKGVCDFFRGQVAFLALGKARPELSSVQEALEELFPEHSHYRAAALLAWERRLRPPPDKAAKADSGYSEGTDSSGTNQETAQDTNTNFKNHRNSHTSRHADNQKLADYFGPPKSEKKTSCRKPVHPPNNLQRLRVRGGIRERQPSVIGPFKHGDVFREADMLSPTLCENCLVRRAQHQGAELINTLSGKVPLPPVSKKHKESSPAVEDVKEDPSPPQPIRNEEKNLELAQLSIPAPDFGKDDAPPQKKTTSELPSDGSDVTLSHIERWYDIGRVVGDGNFAVVRECRRRDDGQTLAMKIVERSKLIGREHMMQNELSLLGSLCHPRIVRLFAHHHTHSHSYLVMELVSGGDLFEAISERGRFSEAAAGLMVSDVSEALNYIHCKSIVHRDLKPENLLIEQVAAGVCRLKLGDFGLAMVVTEPVFTICGTPTYVAPEILCETGYGVAVDVWALGVILYILLCGFPPFRSRDRDQEELFQLIKQGQLHFPSPYWDSVSEEARSLVRALLQPDPAVRLAAEQTLLHPWVKAMASACRQGALPHRSQRKVGAVGREPERLEISPQRNTAESPADAASEHIGDKRETAHEEEEGTNPNRESKSEEKKLPQQQFKEISSGHKHRTQNPGVHLPNTGCITLTHSPSDPPSQKKTHSKLSDQQESTPVSHSTTHNLGHSTQLNSALHTPEASSSPHLDQQDLTSPTNDPDTAPLQNHTKENHNELNGGAPASHPPNQP